VYFIWALCARIKYTYQYFLPSLNVPIGEYEMNSIATGVDMVELDRLERAIQRHGSRFLRRVYTAAELAQTKGNVASLAARFAAKEAVAKALCTGIGPVTWHEIEILRGPAREPQLFLHGAAQQLSENQGLQTWSLSLSHTKTAAVAFVVAIGS
jgi:holo-[acyl-carrier protein] synthase